VSARVWLVGEHNPYGSKPRYALFPYPERSADGRLLAILGMRTGDYMRAFERRNLITDEAKSPRWSAPRAREAATAIAMEAAAEDPFILLGRRVCDAFGLYGVQLPCCVLGPSGPTGEFRRTVVAIPHPSGRCRDWNDPGMIGRVRDLVRARIPQVADAIGADDAPASRLASTDCTTTRPARCSNCGATVEGEHCPDCGPP